MDARGRRGLPCAVSASRERRDAPRNENGDETHRCATLMCATPLAARVGSVGQTRGTWFWASGTLRWPPARPPSAFRVQSSDDRIASS
jgi:hypothetical protein